MLRFFNVTNFVLPMTAFVIGVTFMFFSHSSFAEKIENSPPIIKDITNEDGKSYRLFIEVPDTEPPKQGWPLIVLLDGNTTFPLARAATPNAILLGIGYPTDDRATIVERRYFDLTPHADPDKIPLRPNTKAPQTGGEVLFRKLITKTILPNIKNTYAVDTSQITLFGHSLAGLFVMNTVISSDNAQFNTFCAADPSIWWNGHSFMTQLQAFKKPDSFHPRLLIEVSGQKTIHNDMSEEQKKRLNDLRSGPNGKDVSDYLKTEKGMNNEFRRFNDKNHGTMIAPSIKDCLAFSLPD